MHIGFVYDLRDEYLAAGYSELEVAEFDSAATIDEIEAALHRLGHTVERIGRGQTLARRLANGERYDLVFSIAEGLSGRSREAQVPALCELFDQPCAFSDPLTMAATLDKVVAKQIVTGHGIPTAPYAQLRSAEDAARVALPFPLFVKPVAEGTGKGCDSASIVTNAEELRDTAARLIARFNQPALAETYLPGREFTVGILGTGHAARVIGVAEITVRAEASDPVYSYENKETCEETVIYTLVDDPEAIRAAVTALSAYRALDCRDAARLDFRSDAAGVPHFLEANPIAGLHPSHSDLPIIAALSGLGYDGLIAGIIASAASRLGLPLDAGVSPAPTCSCCAPRTREVASRHMKNLYVPVIHGAALDRPDEQDTVEAAEFIATCLNQLGYSTELIKLGYDFQPIAKLQSKKCFAVFNIVESVGGDSSLEPVAPMLLEHFSLPFTGNGAHCFQLLGNKITAKRMFRCKGLPTADWWTLQDVQNVPDSQLVIVKAVSQHCSLGIDSTSVLNGDQAAEFTKRRMNEFNCEFFVETFVDGREFNVSVLEVDGLPTVLPIPEIVFASTQPSQRIVDYSGKWDEASHSYNSSSREFGVECRESALAESLTTVALECWAAFNLRGYARVDFRVDSRGSLNILEINLNPCLASNAGFIASTRQAGLPDTQLVELIVRAATRAEN